MRYPIKITDNFILEPIMHTFGCKPETAYVELGADTLEVNFGKWFNESVPLSEIASLAPSDWPWWGGLGVKLHHHGIGVVGSTEGVINLRFKTAKKMHVIAVVETEQLWISVDDRDGLLRALSAATGLPIAPHSAF